MIYYIGLVSLLGQTAMLFLQVRAWLRNRHWCFVLLIACSLISLFSIALSYGSILFPAIFPGLEYVRWLAAGSLTLQLVVGTWGAALLFDSYHSLAQRAKA